MNHKRYILLVIAALAMALYNPVEARKKKSRRALTPEKQEMVDMPLPDAPVIPLAPQPLMGQEVRPAHQHEHHVTRRRGRGGGIDVSHYQGNIDWRAVARSGQVQYVYIKATEGGNLIDNTFRQNLMGARRAGLKVGVYHFYRPTATVESQFANLTSNVALRDMDLLPIIDVEIRGKMPLENFQRNLQKFVRIVERHYGVKPIIYTSRDFYNKYLSGPFTGYMYMIARYHDDIPELIDDARFVMWQYTASGRVSGIRGNVDISCFMDDFTLSDIVMQKRGNKISYER